MKIIPIVYLFQVLFSETSSVCSYVKQKECNTIVTSPIPANTIVVLPCSQSLSSLDGDPDDDSDDEDSDDAHSNPGTALCGEDAGDGGGVVRRRTSASSAGNSPNTSPRGSLRESRPREKKEPQRDRAHTTGSTDLPASRDPETNGQFGPCYFSLQR